MIFRLKNWLLGLLRSSERYTKTDMVYLASAGVWLFAARVAAALVGLFGTFVLAKLLSPESFGTYKYVLSLFGVIAAFSLTGLGTSVVQAVSRGFEGAYKSAHRLSLLWSGPMVLLSAGAAGYYFIQNNMVLAVALLVVAATAPFIQSGYLFSSFLIGKQKFKDEAVLGTISAAVPTLCAVVGALYTSDTLITLVAFLVGTAITNALLYQYVLWRTRPNKKEDAESVSFGKHLSLMGILGAVSFQADRILVFHFLGAAALAVYTLALAVPQQLRFGSKVIATAALPKLSAADPAKTHAALPRKAAIIFIVSLIIAGVYIALAPLFFAMVFPEYPDAVAVSQLFALVILFFPATLYQQYLTARMDKKKLYFLQLVPLVKIALLPILIPLYGITGAVLAIFVMELFRLVFVMALFWQARPLEAR